MRPPTDRRGDSIVADTHANRQTAKHATPDGAATNNTDGRDDGDGAFTLYTSPKGDGADLKNFFGVLDGRRVAAREAIFMVLRRVGRNPTPLAPSVDGYPPGAPLRGAPRLTDLDDDGRTE